MMWIVLTVAVLVCGLLLCCVYVLSNKICSLKRQVRELNEKIGRASDSYPLRFVQQGKPPYSVYGSRHECFSLCEQYRGGTLETPRRIAEE